MTGIWIEKAVCSVPKEGTQEERRRLKNELQKSNLSLAVEIESWPWYLDPDGPYGSDDFAQFQWEWMGEDQILQVCESYLPLSVLSELKEMTLGEVRQHSLVGADTDGCSDYSFNLKASYAIAVLKDSWMIPADSVLMNETDQPLSYDEQEETDGAL